MARTAQEIKDYLQGKEWSRWYRDNLMDFQCRTDPSAVNTFLGGYERQETLRKAFIWRDTPEGFYFWQEMNRQFLDWYENK